MRSVPGGGSCGRTLKVCIFKILVEGLLGGKGDFGCVRIAQQQKIKASRVGDPLYL